MQTKKDFIKIAEILNKNLANDEEQEQHIKEKMIKDFCEWFKSENPKFDEVKFREAVLK